MYPQQENNRKVGGGVNRALFSAILKQGKVYHTPHLSLKIFNAPDQQKSSFSFVISRKVMKSAVKRNFLKKQGRHIIRENIIKIKEPHIGAFFIKKGAEKLSFNELQEEIQQLLQKAGVFL